MTLRRDRRRLRLRRFRSRSAEIWKQIPAHFRVDAHLIVHPEVQWDPEDPSVLMLGLCESPMIAAPEYSRIHLWYGSFVFLFETARHFDWKGELEETIFHELTHHWEHRAGLDHLDRFDQAQWQNMRRRRGLPVFAGYWRDGEPVGPKRWEIDGDLFVECPTPPPWTVTAGDGKQVQCAPEDGRPWALIRARGALFDGLRGDLLVAREPVRPKGRIGRFLDRLRGREC